MLRHIKEVSLRFHTLHPNIRPVRALWGMITTTKAEDSSDCKILAAFKDYGEPEIDITFVDGMKKRMDPKFNTTKLLSEIRKIQDRIELSQLIKEMDAEKDEDIAQYLKPPDKKDKKKKKEETPPAK